MGVSSLGLASGIDSATIIEQLVAIEQQKVTTVETAIEADEVSIDAWSTLKSYLTTFQDAAEELADAENFDLFTTTSTDEDIVTVEGGEGATDGEYEVTIAQLAEKEKMVSTDGLITSKTETLASLGITTGTFTINDVEIELDDDDTISDLVTKINAATDSDGDDLGVTATIIQSSSSNFRLVLTADDSGSEGATYTGEALMSLGIIADATGSKGNTTQVVETESTGIESTVDALATGASITITGEDHNGNSVSKTFIKTASNSSEDFLTAVEDAYGGTVEASFDSDGKLILTDKTEGTSELSMDLTIAGTDYSTTVSTVGEEGAGVLNTGKNAYFTVDGIQMTYESNEVEDLVEGVTFTLKSVSTEAETVSLETDVDGIKEKVQTFIDAYNTLLNYSKEVTAYADPDDDESTDGELAGDSTVKTILSQIRSAIIDSYDSADTLSTLTMFGLETDSSTGELSLDSDTFEDACASNLSDLVNIFTSTGTSSDNTSIVLGRYTSDTETGEYELSEDADGTVKIRLSGSEDWYTGTRSGSIITFSDGPADGLSITADVGAIYNTSTSTSTFSFTKGLGDTLDEFVDSQTNSTDGLITLRQQSLNSQISDKEARAEKLQDAVDAYEERLTKQYTALELAISELNSQTSSIVSSLSSSS